MRKRLLHLKRIGLAALLLTCFSTTPSDAQVGTDYTFTQSIGVYVPITGTLVAAANNADPSASPESDPMDDYTFTAIALPFNFNFNGTTYSSFNANTNGWISFGGTSTSSTSSPISSSNAYGAVISAFGTDLQGVTITSGDVTTGSTNITNVTNTAYVKIGAPIRAGANFPAGTVITGVAGNVITVSNPATGTAAGTSVSWASGEIRTDVLGIAPNRVFVIQYSGFAEYASSGTGSTANTNVNFQILLSEGGGSPANQSIEIIYGNIARVSGSETVQVGLRGSINTDYNNRTSTVDWAATTTGLSNSATISWTSTVSAAAGLTYTWTPAACLTPSGLTVSNVSGGSAILSFTNPSASGLVSIEYGPLGFVPGSGTYVTVALDTFYLLVGLNPNTIYSFYARAICGPNDSSAAAGPFVFITAQNVVSTFPWTEDWETGGTDWTILNGGQTNQWFAGTATNNGGSQSLYISNTGGTTNAYNTSSSAVVHAYREIAFPAGNPAISLSFDWRAMGESGYDYLRVWIVPNTFTPTPGTQITAASGGTLLSPDLNQQSGFVTASYTIPPAYAGTTSKLVFEWRNDGSGGSQPPAALDNVMIELGSCAAPTNVYIANLDAGSADVNWTENGTATNWSVEYGPQGFVPGTGTFTAVSGTPSATISGLTVGTTYSAYVRAVCGPNDSSAAAGPVNFTTVGGNSCGTAVSLPVASGYCSPTVDKTTTGATTDTTMSAFACQSNTGGDVWYMITAPASGNIGIIFQAGTVTDLVAAVYSGTCGALTPVAGGCSDDNGPSTLPELHLTGLTAGDTYYIRVAGYSTNSGTFGMCVYDETGIANPANGACNTATATGVGGTVWVPVIAADGKLVAAINPNGVSLGDVTVEYKDYPNGTVPQDTKGQYYLGRYFNFESTNYGSGGVPFPATVSIRLFALDAELDDYNTANSTNYAYTSLNVTMYEGINENCEITDNASTGSSLLSPSERIDNGDGFYLQLNVPHFTEFGIHGGTTPLPVHLTSITAVNSGTRNRVDWTTATEQMTDVYTVERSADGSSFKELTSINARGTAGAYSYWDEQPLQGLNHYRLKITDAAGTVSYSKTVTAFVKSNGGFTLEAYPNPVKDQLTISVTGAIQGDGQVRITDVAGRTLSTATITGSTTMMDVSQLPAGIYLVRYSDNVRQETIRINKQ